MEHTIIYRREDVYAGHPRLDHLDDGRLAVGQPIRYHAAHHSLAGWVTLVSVDEGRTWKETDDPTIPYNWPTMEREKPDPLADARERLDRYARIMPDGSYLCAGGSWKETWPAERRAEAEGLGVRVNDHAGDKSVVIVDRNTMFVQRSTDKGKTWTRKEWKVPNMYCIGSHQWHGHHSLSDGTILVPIYGQHSNGDWRTYVWRSGDQGKTWRLRAMGTNAPGSYAGETAFVEVSPGCVLAHSRVEKGERYLVQMWSEDAGLTWSEPVRTDIRTGQDPADLIKLRDGRILCTYTYRYEPMGIRAVLSNDGGETWDMGNVIILRDDGSTPSKLPRAGTADHERVYIGGDVGYPGSTQLSDGSILTVYYITTPDGVTHSAATRWEV